MEKNINIPLNESTNLSILYFGAMKKMENDLFGRIKVVLASPGDSRNIGAVCRAMKNMALESLVIADASGINIKEVKTHALHACDLFENAVFYDSLEEAVKGASFVAGITRRRGKFRKYMSLTPDQLAAKISETQSGRIALVFGNEEYGLTDSELALCHSAVHIPSSESFPSLNLSHAVQIIAYEIYKVGIREAQKGLTPVSGDELESLVRGIVGSLSDIGFFTQVTDADMSRFLRDIFARAMLAPAEAERLVRIFDKIKGIAMSKNNRK